LGCRGENLARRNGFTSGIGILGVPELKADYLSNLELKDGAEIFKFDYLKRQEVLVVVYDESIKMFVKK